jgi:protein-tyrosine phosphatase
MLKRALPELEVSSAGLAALVGHAADADATQVAAEIGLDLAGHSARQMTAKLGAMHGLILVMEPWQKAEVARLWPQLSGRTMQLDQWTGGQGIADPYRAPLDFHRRTRDQILAAVEAWATRLV